VKKLTLVLTSILFLGACGKIDNLQPGSQLLRDLVSSGSTAAQMRAESRDIKSTIEDVASAQQRLSDLCDGLGEQVAAFNDALGSRQADLARLIEERDDIALSLAGAKADFDAASDQETQLTGQINGIGKRIGYLNRPTTMRSLISSEKSRLNRQRRTEKSHARAALRALGRAAFPSDDFDRAEADLRAARLAIVDIDNQLRVLSQTISANVANEISALRSQLPDLESRRSVAQIARITAEPFVVNFRVSLRAKQRQIVQAQRFENLLPFTTPVICERI